MAHQVDIRCCALTDRGMVRDQNEDAVAVWPHGGVAILADGMGGYSAGEVASSMAVEVCTEVLQQGLESFDWDRTDRASAVTTLLHNAVHAANNAILAASLSEPRQAGMGTTLVLSLLHHDRIVVAHVGDSRLYRLRDGAFTQLTRDHSHVQDLVDAGLLSPEQARVAPNRNLVTRAVGIAALIQVDLQEFGTRAGDLYLLCSDGLSDMIDDGEIRLVLLTPGQSLEAAATRLVDQANAVGGVDNISVILISVDSIGAGPAGILGRMLDWVN
jgi:serine/threonine protein phosphatase PrpC